MKVFKHTGVGHYIGSCVIVAAKDRAQAKNMIRKELDSNGLDKEHLNITEVLISKAIIVHSDNGDY